MQQMQEEALLNENDQEAQLLHGQVQRIRQVSPRFVLRRRPLLLTRLLQISLSIRDEIHRTNVLADELDGTMARFVAVVAPRRPQGTTNTNLISRQFFLLNNNNTQDTLAGAEWTAQTGVSGRPLDSTALLCAVSVCWRLLLLPLVDDAAVSEGFFFSTAAFTRRRRLPTVERPRPMVQ